MSKQPNTPEDDDAYLTHTINDEALRCRVRQLVKEPKRPSWIARLASNQLFGLVTGFVLSGVIGGFLTNYYADRQAERQHARTFADEINKTRVSKIGEVWEKLDLYDAGVKSIVEKIKIDKPAEPGSPTSPTMTISAEDLKSLPKIYEESDRLYLEVSAVIEKNRFWLGDAVYDDIKKYISTTSVYYQAHRAGHETKGIEEARRQSRTGINQIRDRMLKGEL